MELEINYPWINIEENIVTCPDGHQVQLLAYKISPNLAPQVVVLGGLLSHEECDQLVALSEKKLAPSRVVDRNTGEYVLHDERTSEGTFFYTGENELAKKIEARIEFLTQWPTINGEGLQILHYTHGGEYKPHHDYFDPKDPGNAKVLETGGQRLATMIMYLNNCPSAGSTVFPNFGLFVNPLKGNAVFFNYPGQAGVPDALCLHGGTPVLGGEKWIATKWLRERPYV